MGIRGLLLAVVLLPMTAFAAPRSTAPEPEPITELSLGDWNGGAQAWGTAWANEEGFQLLWVAMIKSTFTFTVTESAVTGTFDLWSEGLYGNDQMAMTLSGGNGQTFGANWNINRPAGGTIGGMRDQLIFDSNAITTSGTARAGGVTIPFTGDPSAVTIRTTIEYLACDHVIGNWDFSIITQIESAGWEPAWSGYWAAVPNLDDAQETAREELINGLSELFTDFADFQGSLGTSLGPEPDYDPSQLDGPGLLQLVVRATEIANRLHNLSPCDTEAIGEDVLREWETALASGVGDLIIAAADYMANTGEAMHFATLNALVAGADATGAYGSGSPLNAGEQFQIEEALVELTSNSAERHLNVSAQEGNPDCELSCREDNYLWAAGAAAEAATHGWPLTVNGTTYPPGDYGDLFADPPGNSTQ